MNKAISREDGRRLLAGMKKPAAKLKYRNVKVVDGAGNKFDSKAEQRRHAELQLMQRAGEIFMLQSQVPFVLVEKAKGRRAIKYLADFAYLTKDGRQIVEDVKSEATRKNPVYVMKKKMMSAIHGIDIVEVG